MRRSEELQAKMKKDNNGVKEDSNSSGSGFGFLRSMLRGEEDTSNESFFKRTLRKLFGSESNASSEPDKLSQNSRSKGPIIEEVDSDGEGTLEDKEGREESHAARSNKNPIVELPEDQDEDDGRNERNSKDILHRAANRGKEEKDTRSVSFTRVTYGGINGAYYTATSSRVTTNGVTLEETKHADRSTGQAAHQISRGINGKGHSVLRKLNSDGKVDTRQILHNINEDELLGFEKAWKHDADRHLHGWNDKLNPNIGKMNRELVAMGSYFQDPFIEHSNRKQGQEIHKDLIPQSSTGRSKKIVTVNID
ncbi:uncharacterized protein LOC127261562 isoform X2 [Andrographis paniculata]|uniref:uncharacterized protein LOC127261562 isoform X2 n=1 Tax=Andrographis paniculata TaxID=175694 RepID=UPI0021E7F92E|nr:uncharacterized protein LOC127261562 isoform X2 [Andrographis paniculata]